MQNENRTEPLQMVIEACFNLGGEIQKIAVRICNLRTEFYSSYLVLFLEAFSLE